MDKLTIGFVGLGRMGRPMSARISGAGYPIVLFDSNREALVSAATGGARMASSLRELASQSDVVLVSLPTPQVVEAVVMGDDGLVTGSRCKTVVDLSTTGPTASREIARRLADRGIAWIDAPVSGGVAGATKGTLALMISGPKHAVQLVEPILEPLGKRFYVGEAPGLGQVAKLANNLMAASALAITSEAFAMAAKAGLNLNALTDVVNASSGRNTATVDKFPRSVLTRTFDFGFATSLSYKDVKLCIDEAESLGVPMVAGAAVRQMLAITQAKFGPGSDFTSIARVVEEWAGVEIKG